MEDLDPQLEALAAKTAKAAAPIFAVNGWEYAKGFGSERKTFVPDEEYLTDTVLRLLRNVARFPNWEEDANTSTGRFTVCRDTYDESTSFSVILELGDLDVPRNPDSFQRGEEEG